MEVSQVPHEKEDLHGRVSRLETRLLQLLNDYLAIQEQCNALTASITFLEDSLANSAASSIQKLVSVSNKCENRRLDALPKAQSVLRMTTSSPQESGKKPPEVSHRASATLH